MIIFLILVIAVVVWVLLKNNSQNGERRITSPVPTPSNTRTDDWEVTWKPTAQIKDSGNCGPNATWTLYEDGQLIIRGTGAMYDYKHAAIYDGTKVTPWYKHRMMIRSAKVGKGITHLGDWVFGYCKNLETVTLSCSSEIMPYGGFYDCDALRRIVIPYGVRKISISCFQDCDNLREVYISNGVTAILDCAFFNCKNLTSVFLPESVKEIKSLAFADCPNLTRIRIPRGIEYVHKNAFSGSGIRIK